MITEAQAIDLLVLWLNIGLAVLALAAFGALVAAVWVIRGRQKAHDDYLAAREKIEQGTRIVHIEPTTPWPKK